MKTTKFQFNISKIMSARAKNRGKGREYRYRNTIIEEMWLSIFLIRKQPGKQSFDIFEERFFLYNRYSYQSKPRFVLEQKLTS